MRPGFVDTEILQGNKDNLFWVATVEKGMQSNHEGNRIKKKCFIHYKKVENNFFTY